MDLQPGAWGGGNQFGRSLSAYLKKRGVTVSYDLADSELDIILLVEPNARLRISAYDHAAILRYLAMKNRRAIVVHRINNTSEARDDAKREFNKYRIDANLVADHTVFVSQWVKERYEESGFDPGRPTTVILNGSDKKLWKPGGAKKTAAKKLRVVTHHWSGHWNKGFAVYKRLDEMLADPQWSDRLEFTYIGRLPDGFAFENSRYIEPMSGEPLAQVLREHDFYITGALFESGGHHNLEAGLCGLPILYLDSGSMAEYCRGYGLEFTMENLGEKLGAMMNDLPGWRKKMVKFPHTADNMCRQYHDLFTGLLKDRERLLAQRQWLRRLPWLWKTMMKSRGNG